MLAGNGDDLGSRGHALLGMYTKEYVCTIRLVAHVAQTEVSLDCKNFEAGNQNVVNREMRNVM